MNFMAYVPGRGWEDWTHPANPNVRPEFVTHWMEALTPPPVEEE